MGWREEAFTGDSDTCETVAFCMARPERPWVRLSDKLKAKSEGASEAMV